MRKFVRSDPIGLDRGEDMGVLRHVVFATLILCVALGAWQMGHHGARAYERMIAQRVMNGLDVLGYSWAEIRADGLHLELHGHAPDSFARDLAYESARASAPLAHIENYATATLAPPERRDPVRVELHRDKRGVTMTGQTASRDMRQRLNDAFTDLEPEMGVHDLTGIQAALPRRPMQMEIRVAALAASRLPNAYVVMTPGRVTINGQAGDTEDRVALIDALQEIAGGTVALALRIGIPAEVIAPFSFSAHKDIGTPIRLERCAARTVQERATIVAHLESFNADLQDIECRVGLGGPGGDWVGAIKAALDGLTALPAGRIDVEYRSARLLARPPTGAYRFEDVQSAFRAALPNGFEAWTDLRADDVATRIGDCP